MLNLAPRIAIGLTLPWSKRAPPLYLLLRSLCSCTSSLLLETLSAIPLFTFFHVFTSLLLRFLFLFLFLFFLFSFITLFYFHDGGISLFFAFNIRHGGTYDSTDLSRTRWVFHWFRINLLYPAPTDRQTRLALEGIEKSGSVRVRYGRVGTGAVLEALRLEVVVRDVGLRNLRCHFV